jgi:hypothetical protein
LLVKRDATGQALYAARSYRPGDIVVDFAEVEWRTQRDRHTVQHPTGAHIFHPVLAMVSHGCEPNCEIQVVGRMLVASRPIGSGEAISFDYARTETRFVQPFACLCGSRHCRGRIG